MRHATFVGFDDPDYIDNSYVKAGVTLQGIKWAFTTWYASNWHPLTWLSHMLDCQLFGLDPGAQHLVNVVFHAANAALLFLFLFRATNKLWPAAFVAALFAWHPLHVESVAWVSERKDVLSTFFGLLTLLAYVRYAEEFNIQRLKAKVWWRWALAFFALGLMAKPMLVTLPFVMLLLDVWPLRRFPARVFHAGDTKSVNTQHATHNTTYFALLSEKAPFILLTIASCIITFLAQREEAVMSFEQRPLGLRLANSLVAYAEYLGKTFCPMKLAVIYPLPNQIPAWQIGIAALVLVSISGLAWTLRRKAPYLLVGWLWFLGTLVPVIGLVQVGGQALADRYTYIPLIGVFIAVAYGAADLAVRFRINAKALSVTAAVVLTALTVKSSYQIRFWQDSDALFTHAIEVTSNNAIAHIDLGVAYEEEGRREDAVAQYDKAIEIDPNRFQAHNNLANLLSSMGKREEGLKEFDEALRLNPKAMLAHANLGTLLSEMGRYDDAMREYTTAENLMPTDPRPEYLMGKACLRQGESAEAVKHFRNALRVAPDDVQTLTWLARVLASDKDPSVRYAADAVTLAKRANELSGGDQPSTLDILAMAYAEAGRFQEAQQAETKAIDFASANDKEAVPVMQDRLQLYQSNRTYREDFTHTLSSPK